MDLFLGVPPTISSLLNPPLSLAACGGFQRLANPKLFKILRVLRAFFPCLFSADVATATVSAPPSSPMLFQRSRREGLMLKGVVGAIILFYLNWLFFTKASG